MANRNTRMAERRQRLLDYLDQWHDGPVRLTAIAAEIGASVSTTHRDLVALCEADVVVHRKPGYELATGQHSEKVIRQLVERIRNQERGRPEITEIINEYCIERIVKRRLEPMVIEAARMRDMAAAD